MSSTPQAPRPPAWATAIDNCGADAPAIGASRIGRLSPKRVQKLSTRSRVLILEASFRVLLSYPPPRTRKGSGVMSDNKNRLAIATACLLLPLAGSAEAPAQRTPITHEKLWMMKRVSEPAVSPDGKWVVFSVLEPSYDQDKEVSDLWLPSVAGSQPPRRLTN